MIISHLDNKYKLRRINLAQNAFNGAYYYSKEIVENIIPNVNTDRNWITINTREGADHSILFVHDNLYFENTYRFMQKYEDVVYVVSLPDMIERAKEFGKVVYLPMSVDVGYVKTFKREKDKGTAFCGRTEWVYDAEKNGASLPEDADRIEMLPRVDFLKQMARYENVYAVCRVAIEAKVLGCNVLPFHPRFPDPNQWEVIDNREAAQMLQVELDRIDK